VFLVTHLIIMDTIFACDILTHIKNNEKLAQKKICLKQ